MVLVSAKITGTGAAVALSTALPQPSGYTAGKRLRAKYLQILAPSGNASSVLVGGTEVSSTVGFPLVAGASQFLAPVSQGNEFIDLNLVKVYIANADIVNILYYV